MGSHFNAAVLKALIAVVDGVVDSILEDTGTTIPNTLATIAAYLDTEVAAILTDTETTIPGTITTLQAAIDAIKAITDALPDAGALSTIQADLDNPSQYKADVSGLAPSGEYNTEMARITANVALASVLGALNSATGSGAVSDAKVAMTYLKQLVTDLITLATAVGNIPTTMVGTDGAALASAWSAALASALGNYNATRAGYLDNIDTKAMGRLQIATTTADLNQAAATYDLFTGTTQAVVLEKLNIKMPTGAAGGSVTSIAIVTDDATAGTIIGATDGAVANLTSEADLGWTGVLLINVGTKIRLTIAGGAHGSEYLTTVVTQYRAVVSGGYLA